MGKDFIISVIVGIVASYWLYITYGGTPFAFALIGAAGWIAWRVYQKHPYFVYKRTKADMDRIFAEAQRKFIPAEDEKTFIPSLWKGLWADRNLPDELTEPLIRSSMEIYEQEPLEKYLRDAPVPSNAIAVAEYKDYLAAPKRDRVMTDMMKDIMRNAYKGFIMLLPEPEQAALTFQVKLKDAPNIHQLVFQIIRPFYDDRSNTLAVFDQLRNQINKNTHDASGVMYRPNEPASPRLKLPTQYEGSDVEWAYLKHTPLLQIFNAPLPFVIPDKARFEHMHIIAPTGQGKTNLLQYMILKDIEQVKKGKCSLVILDSKNQLLRKLRKLKDFAPHQPLWDKLVYVNPRDIRHPVALSPFSMGRERLSIHDDIQREQLQNSLIELLTFTLGSLKDQKLTGQQTTLFRYALRLMMVIPDATIHTLRDLLAKGSEKHFFQYYHLLDNTARSFFETQFSTDQFLMRRDEVSKRIFAILESQSFERLMVHPESKLDIFTEINQPKVILINAEKSLLRDEGTEVFGRFFIALMAQAAEERSTIPKEKRLPCYFYIDEFADYAKNADQNITNILNRAREFGIGIIVAHQFLSQLSDETRTALATNTAIKFAGGGSYDDNARYAREMKTTVEMISNQPTGSFAAFVRGKTDSAASLRVPLSLIPEFMDDEEWEYVKNRNREKYAANAPPASAPPPKPADAEEDLDNIPL